MSCRECRDKRRHCWRDLRSSYFSFLQMSAALPVDVEQAKELKAEYVRTCEELRGLQKELCVREKEL